MARPRREGDTEPIDRLLRALGDPTRRRIVELLSTRPHSMTALADACGITVTAVGQHLQILEAANLVATSKLGRVRSCEIDHSGFATLQHWLAARRSPWEKRLDALDAVLARRED